MTDPDEVQLSKLAKKMLDAPPKPHSEMKIGKRKAKAEPKERLASKGRVHKGRTRG